MAKTHGPAINPKGTAAKMWPVEKPLLNAIARQKGYKRAPFKGGPPNGTVKGLLHVFHTVELKKPKAGHVREYRKKYEHTRSFLGERRKRPEVRINWRMFRQPQASSSSSSTRRSGRQRNAPQRLGH